MCLLTNVTFLKPIPLQLNMSIRCQFYFYYRNKWFVKAVNSAAQHFSNSRENTPTRLFIKSWLQATVSFFYCG